MAYLNSDFPLPLQYENAEHASGALAFTDNVLFSEKHYFFFRVVFISELKSSISLTPHKHFLIPTLTPSIVSPLARGRALACFPSGN